MKTTVDIDDAILREAESQARQQGKSLATLMEEALRTVIVSPTASQSAPANSVAEGLDENDPFFTALAEIRALGRAAAARPAVNLQ